MPHHRFGQCRYILHLHPTKDRQHMEMMLPKHEQRWEFSAPEYVWYHALTVVCLVRQPRIASEETLLAFAQRQQHRQPGVLLPVLSTVSCDSFAPCVYCGSLKSRCRNSSMYSST